MDYPKFGTVVATIAVTGPVEHVGSKTVDSVSDGARHFRFWFASDEYCEQLVQVLELKTRSTTLAKQAETSQFLND